MKQHLSSRESLIKIAEEYAGRIENLGISAEVRYPTALANVIKIRIQHQGRAIGYVCVYQGQGKPTYRVHELKDSEIARVISLALDGHHEVARAELKKFDAAICSTEAMVYVATYDPAPHLDVGIGVIITQNDSYLAERAGTIAGGKIHGEISGLLDAIQWCAERGLSKLVCCQRALLHNWVSGHFRANKPITRQLVDEVRRFDGTIKWTMPDEGTSGYAAALEHAKWAAADQ